MKKKSFKIIIIILIILTVTFFIINKYKDKIDNSNNNDSNISYYYDENEGIYKVIDGNNQVIGNYANEGEAKSATDFKRNNPNFYGTPPISPNSE